VKNAKDFRPFRESAPDYARRDPATGRVGRGAQLARKHPKPPTPDDPAIAMRLAERRAAIVADRGGLEQLTAVQLAAIDRFTMLELFVEGWERFFVRSGLMSRQGRVRSGYAAGYLATVAQLMRLSQLIGLDRAARTVPDESPREWLERTKPHVHDAHEQADTDAEDSSSTQEESCP
jgi:hypothetical protein